jgi:general secretion pathway protein J
MRRTRGFTLIELMVALAILSIVLSSIYATFFSALRAMRDTRERDDTYQIARVVMEKMSNDLAMAFYRPGSDREERPTQLFIGRDATEDDFAHDRLDFTTASHVLLRDGRPETDVVEVSYYIDNTYRDRSLLVRREDPLPDEDLRHGGTLRVLAERVVGLNFRYREPGPMPYDRQRRTGPVTEEEEEVQEPAWHDAWNADTWQPARKSLPELVEITLTIRDKDDQDHQFTTTVLLHPYQVWR